MEQLRRRVTDKRVLRLVRQFLAAGIMRHGSLTATPSGTPQGAILSPLLANVALSVLDRRFEDAWNACTPHQRKWRMAKGHPSYRMIRYADDFVILIRGTKAQAQALKERTAEFMREQMRLTLSPRRRTSPTSTTGRVEPGRGAGVTAGPFPRPARRTGRARLQASGSPQDVRWPIVALV